ncbi:MAG TPA: ribulose-phosphate 3-epimerase [Coriobacteriia bacterium]|nr:ribulose-phosphate 3-epimerase [Coriobacteriia bacterium]
MTERVLMAPSILSADFTDLGSAVRLIQDGGADLVHVDVMDGHFVPNLTVGPPVVKALKRVATIPLDVHLMIANAETSLGSYLDAGADWVTVHVEACTHVHRVLRAIRSSGARCGVSLNPGTPVESLRDILGEVDLVLIMSVNPGFGGQSFIVRSVDRIRRLTELCEAEGVSPLIQVDGGIDATTAPLVAQAGARCLVAGSAVYCADDAVAAMNAIRRAAQAVL